VAAALVEDAVHELGLADGGENPEAELAWGAGNHLGRRWLKQSEGCDEGSRKVDVEGLLEPGWSNGR
jgi:hypothetical protein